jgi:L-alanine-DL-glutamate epimerase-like enolase superfamily enzyme
VFGYQHIIEAGAADIVQPSVTKVGGLSEMKKIAALAAARGTTFVPHAFYFGPGLAASVHVAAATPGIPFVEFPPEDLETPLLAEPIRCVNGAVLVPERPGLGADPNPEALARHPFRRDGDRPFYLT